MVQHGIAVSVNLDFMLALHSVRGPPVCMICCKDFWRGRRTQRSTVFPARGFPSILSLTTGVQGILMCKSCFDRPHPKRLSLTPPIGVPGLLQALRRLACVKVLMIQIV